MLREQKSFTLIELLVVIAIIGILAAMIVISVGIARKKANDARIKTDLAQMPKVAEMWFNDHGSYDGFCDGSQNVDYQTLINDISSNGGTDIRCYGQGDKYAVSSDLNKERSRCLDSTSANMTGEVGGIKCVALAEIPEQPSDFSYYYIIQGNATLTDAQE